MDNSAVNSEDTEQPPVRDAPAKEIISEATPQKPQIQTSPPVNESPKIKKSGFREGLKRVAESVKEFAVQHPVLTEVVKVVGVATAGYLLDRAASSGGGSGGGGSDYTSTTDSYDDTYSALRNSTTPLVKIVMLQWNKKAMEKARLRHRMTLQDILGQGTARWSMCGDIRLAKIETNKPLIG